MRLHMDFDMSAVISVLNEMATRSVDGDQDVICVTPVTHHHFGAPHYYVKKFGRYAWVRPYKDGDETKQDRLVVAFGYQTPPEAWRNGDNRHYMKHAHAFEVKDAADMLMSFLLDNVLPEELFNGDYHYHEPELEAVTWPST